MPRILLALAVVLCVMPTTAEAAETKIAVVDMATLIQNHPDAKALDDRFQSAKSTAQGNWDRTQQDLQTILGKINKMTRNDPERRREMRKYEQRKVNAEFSRRWAEREAVNEYVRALERIYMDVKSKVNKYARDHSINLVLQRETDVDEVKAASLDDFFVKLRLRTVLYHTPELDITKQVQAMWPKPKDGK